MQTFSFHTSFTHWHLFMLNHLSFCCSRMAIRCRQMSIYYSWHPNTNTSAITKATHTHTRLLVGDTFKGGLYCRSYRSALAVAHSKIQHQHDHKCLIRQKNNLINEYCQHGIKTSRHSQRTLFRSLANTPPRRAGVSAAPPPDELQKVDMIWQHKNTEWQHVKHTVVWLIQITFSFLH